MNPLRLDKLQQQLQAHNLDGVALMPAPNMVYFSHIHSHVSERPIILFIPCEGEPAILIPTLEAMKAEAVGIKRIFAWNDTQGYVTAFQQASEALNLNSWKMGVEALHMRVLERDMLLRVAPDMEIVHADHIFATIRMVKEEAEIEAMLKAIAVAETAMEKLLPRIKIGQTEKQVAAMLSQLLMDEGADSIAFGPIVSTGVNAASPHAVPTDTPLQAGDLLVIDWGVYVDGYPSDITRTFAVGEIDEESKRIYNTVLKANEQGKAVAKPHATGQDVDRAAREVIEEMGYGDYFIHRTGHGLGLEVHEPPFMMEGYTEPLLEGHVFTVEPGIYVPNKVGVRIEDDVVITANGRRVLTTFPRDLITIGL